MGKMRNSVRNNLIAWPIWPGLCISLFCLALQGRILSEQLDGQPSPLQSGEKYSWLLNDEAPYTADVSCLLSLVEQYINYSCEIGIRYPMVPCEHNSIWSAFADTLKKNARHS